MQEAFTHVPGQKLVAYIGPMWQHCADGPGFLHAKQPPGAPASHREPKRTIGASYTAS